MSNDMRKQTDQNNNKNQMNDLYLPTHTLWQIVNEENYFFNDCWNVVWEK